MMTSATPFLDKLSRAKEVGGIYLFEHYLSLEEADEAFQSMNQDTNFPWNLSPKLFGDKLSQHAFEYTRFNDKEVAKSQDQVTGLTSLENICIKIENDFDVKIDAVFCNRFQNPMHHIDWHKDTYGRHIMVLSLGSKRKVQFKDNKTEDIVTVEPATGDMYFMPLRLNDTHKHRVCHAEGADSIGTRISFVFFLRVPKYAKEFKITMGDKMKGAFTFVTGIGA